MLQEDVQQTDLRRAQFGQTVHHLVRNEVKSSAMLRQLNSTLNPGHFWYVLRDETGRYFPRFLRILPTEQRLEKDLQNA